MYIKGMYIIGRESMNKTLSRRQVSKGTVSIGLGGFAVGSLKASAQDATPAASPVKDSSPGYASLRVRQLTAPEFRTAVNDIVISEFAPDVQALPGYGGYILGDVIDDDTQSLSIVVFEEAAQAEGFAELAQTFVGGLDPEYAVETPTAVEGELLITAAGNAAEATPVSDPGANRFIAVRIYTSLPGTDPRDFVPLATEGFIPIVTGIPGFQGYFLSLSDGGFTSINVFDSEESALESTAAGTEWAAENLTAFTEGDPQVITAMGIFVDLPVLAG